MLYQTGDLWQLAQVAVSPLATAIDFIATQGDNVESSIAIDDVVMTIEPCA